MCIFLLGLEWRFLLLFKVSWIELSVQSLAWDFGSSILALLLRNTTRMITLYCFFLDSKVASKPKPFYFKDMWILDYGFIPLVGRIWRTSIIKNAVVRVIGKLRLVKATLRSWNVEMFRNMHNAIKVAKDKLGFGLNSY